MSDDSWKYRGPHVVCRAMEASLRAEASELRRRIRLARLYLVTATSGLDVDDAVRALDLRRNGVFNRKKSVIKPSLRKPLKAKP